MYLYLLGKGLVRTSEKVEILEKRSSLSTGWTVRASNLGGGEIFRTCPNILHRLELRFLFHPACGVAATPTELSCPFLILCSTYVLVLWLVSGFHVVRLQFCMHVEPSKYSWNHIISEKYKQYNHFSYIFFNIFPMYNYTFLPATVKLLETFLVASLYKPFQLSRRILNDVSNIIKTPSFHGWFQSKEQVKICCS